jgi:hypothetical protein
MTQFWPVRREEPSPVFLPAIEPTGAAATAVGDEPHPRRLIRVVLGANAAANGIV